MIETKFRHDKANSEFDAIFDAHRPYKKLTVFFDKENYWLTEYRDVPDYGAFMLLESFDGELVVIHGCNCGYGGVGPQNSEEILVRLGIERNVAERYVLCSGIELEFNQEGVLINETNEKNVIFESREQYLRDNQVLIGGQRVFSDFSFRRLYFLNPAQSELSALHRAIDHTSPDLFTYYIGKNARAYVDYDIPFEKYYGKNKLMEMQGLKDGPFCLINSDDYEIACLFDHQIAHTFINYMHLYLTGKALFREVSLGGVVTYNGGGLYTTTQKLNVYLKMLLGKMEEQYDKIGLPLSDYYL